MAAKERFSVSMDASTRALVKRHAEAMGLDVSAYVTAAVLRQVEEDEVVARRFADIDAAISAAESVRVPAGADVEISEADLAAARTGIAQALASADQEAA
jgi:hypothetical protein